MILGFAHPCLVVSNSESVKDFYCSMFGFSVISEEAWENQPAIDKAIDVTNSNVKGFMLAGHNCFLEIHEYLSPQSSEPSPDCLKANDKGIRHLAFLVDDCHFESKRFEQLGGSLFSEPVEMAEGIYAVYGRDPFGHIIELCEPMGKNEKLSALAGVNCEQRYSGE